MALDGNTTTFLPYTLNGLQEIAADSQVVQTLQVNSLTPNRVVVSDSGDFLVSAGVSTTEVDYLIGTTSNVQSQLNSKASTSYVDANFVSKTTSSDQTMSGQLFGSTFQANLRLTVAAAGFSPNTYNARVERVDGDYVIEKDNAVDPIETILRYDISASKWIFPDGVASKVPIWDADKGLVSSGVDSIKITYLDNVSSDIQSQLNARATTTYVDNGLALKQNLAGGNTITGTQTYSDQTASRVSVFDASKNLVSSSTTTTQLSYLDASSSIQTQLNGKANSADLANYLPLAGGTMTGAINMASGSITDGLYVFAKPTNADYVQRWRSAINHYSGTLSNTYLFNGPAGTILLSQNTTRSATNANLYLGQDLLGSCSVASVKSDGSAGFLPLYLTGTPIILTGNVGVGTSTTNAPLQFSNDLVNRKLVLYDAVNNNHQYYGFGINANTLRYQVSDTGDNHVFFTGTSATTSTELMRIQGNGNVGIGTTTPDVHLQVYGKGKFHDGTTGVPVNGVNGGNGTRLILWPGVADATPYALGINGSTLWYGTPSGALHAWYEGTTERMRLIGGRLGIGTASPAATLDIYNTTSDWTNNVLIRQPWAGVLFDNTQLIGGRKWALFNGGDGAGIGKGNFGIFDATASAYRFFINSSGGVGINVESTSYRLEVSGDTRISNGTLSVYSATANSNGGSNFFVSNQGSGNSYAVMYLSSFGANCYWFLNSQDRSADGGPRTATIRNDNGDLRLQSSGGNRGIYISGDGLVSIGNSTGNSSGILNIWNRNGSITHFNWTDNGNYLRGAFTRIDTPVTISSSLSVGDGSVQTLMGLKGGNTAGTWGNFPTWPSNANGLLISSVTTQNANTAGAFLGFNGGSTYLTSLAPSVSWLNMYFHAAGMFANYFGSQVSALTSSGWQNVSDEREKEDIQPIKTTSSLRRVLALEPKHYRRKYYDRGNPVPDHIKSQRCIGFIAQEVQKTNPHCVHEWVNENENDEIRFMMSYNDYIVHLVGAVQEQQKQIDVLTQRNQLLEQHARQLETDFNDYKDQTDRRMTQLAELVREILSEKNPPKLSKQKSVKP